MGSLAAMLAWMEVPALGCSDYQIIEWQQRSVEQLATLKGLGVTAGTVIANRDGTGPTLEHQIAPFLANGMRWYIENIATDYYAPYHRWSSDRPVNWKFNETQRRYQQNPQNDTALWREPSLADLSWQQRIRDRLMAIVRGQALYHPIYYSLGDETGIADLSAFWDFDLSPGSLDGMRDWLRQGYGSLKTLNAEWDTNYASWRDVRPETTRQAMRRIDDNFAAWADFKAWMDVAFARSLRIGTEAVHRADPSALAGIEGAQMPGWGGYDYTLLANAVDVMEMYDMGDNVPIARSLNPHLITLTTSSGSGPEELHAIWRALLRGSCGLILWDQDNDIVRRDGSIGERGQGYASTFAELRGGVAGSILRSEPYADPVAILYSPASFRTQWMLDHRPMGDAWMTRSAETELEDNAVRIALRGYARTLAHRGTQPVYLSPAMVEQGLIRSLGIKLLILPHAVAISPEMARVIRDFTEHGGSVIADTAPGIFDSHSRRLASPLAVGLIEMIAPDDATAFARIAARAGVMPMAQISAPSADVEAHVYRSGNATIVALQRDFSTATSGETIVITLPRAAEVYDLRQHQNLGSTDRIERIIDPIVPTFLSIEPYSQ